ncbi:hypothetical protein Adi01nite_70830 [Amorphoplanes digitatis]|nr:hypothetical protein GCM10020092_081210 [Actinoplanes digitatis]GID97671.1 hypothetical protein Adi01nite_70830 [Actinoplanes digitatis]
MERWIQAFHHQLLDRTLIWNQAHLRHALREYERHHNSHRPHQGIANARPLRPLPDPVTEATSLTPLNVRRNDRSADYYTSTPVPLDQHGWDFRHPQLRMSAAPPQRRNEDQIAAIVDGLGSLLGVLREADPRDKAELYSRIGLRLTYKPGLKTLKAEVVSDLGRVLSVCPRPNMSDKYTEIASRVLACAP